MFYIKKIYEKCINLFVKMVNVINKGASLDSGRTGRYPNFDTFRLLLATEVVFVHSWASVDSKFSWPGIVMAVPTFLAISGFLVLQSYSESGSWMIFLKKRFIRIIPALVVSFILCYLLLGSNVLYNSLVTWLSGGIYGINGIRNVPLWSLAWEEIAYFLLAILWIFGVYKKPFWIWIIFLLSLTLPWVASGVSLSNRSLLFLAPAFFLGNLMYLYRRYLLSVSNYFPWIFLFFVIYFSPTFMRGTSAEVLLIFIAQAFSIVWVSMSGFKIIPFKFPDLSYGLYIYHYPLILFLKKSYEISNLKDMLLIVTIVILPLAALSWYLIEKPILIFKKRKIFSAFG